MKKRKIFSYMLMGLLTLGTTAAVTSCKDYDDDIDNLQKQNDDLTKQLSTLQSALDQAKADAATAHAQFATTKSVNDLATEIASLAKASDLQSAIDDINALKTGKASQEDLDALKTKIDGIDTSLNTLGSRLTDVESAQKSAQQNIESQQAAIKTLQEQIAQLQNTLKEQGTTTIAGIQTKLTDLQKSLDDLKANAANASDVKTLQADMQKANEAVNAANAQINILTVFIKKQLTSLVLRPDMYYGGIEGVNIFSIKTPIESPKDRYHYFVRDSLDNLSSVGLASYHINPATADLAGYNLDFYSWESDIKAPATSETRASNNDKGKGYVWTEENNNTFDKLIKNNPSALKNGILTVPFKANITAVDAALANSKGIIMSLQMSKAQTNGKDTTVNSDYALVVPKHAYQLILADKSFNNNGVETHVDNIAVDEKEDKVNSNHLHRSFGALAWNNTPATHEVQYDKSIDITALLETHYINKEGVQVKDTLANDHKRTAATYKGKTGQREGDGDATLNKEDCDILTEDQFNGLGLHYEIHPVDYTLGTTGTDESAHIQLSTDGNGHVIATPRNVTADGKTIENQVANRSSVGRTPILCIEVKDSKNRTLTFGYMKLLIVDQPQEVAFDVPSVYADCNEAWGQLTWSQVEYHIYNDLLNVSKEYFDTNYTFDYNAQAGVNTDPTDQTKERKYRIGNQFDKVNGKFVAKDKTYGQVWEVWNQGEDQPTLDATTHILKWYFSKDDYFKLFNDLKAAGKLKLEGNSYVNVDPIETYVRYKNNGSDDYSIYIKLTIDAGKYHFAAGTLGNQKVLSYWYNLNSSKNATSNADAYEVRVNVPVPTPGTPGVTNTAVQKDLGSGLIFNYDDNLERVEFIKDLHDFFKSGKLDATITDSVHFKNLAKYNLTPEFQFTLPSKSLGNAKFDAAADGTWTVKGYTGATYTLKLNAAKNEIRIVKKNDTVVDELLVKLADDKDKIQSVLQYQQGDDMDDILNYKGHNELAERETFTAYIEVTTPEACAPVIFDQSWFNVRFLRPLDFLDPKQAITYDAPNDWQYVNLSKLLEVRDWRDYVGDPTNANKGTDQNNRFDFAYYHVKFDTDKKDILTDAVLGTSVRDLVVNTTGMVNYNDPNNVYGNGKVAGKELDNVSVVPGLELYVVYSTDNGKTWSEDKPTVESYEVGLKYKNNSGVTGNYHWFVPVTMSYVFGQNVVQKKWVTVGLSHSVQQGQTAKRH